MWCSLFPPKQQVGQRDTPDWHLFQDAADSVILTYTLGLPSQRIYNQPYMGGTESHGPHPSGSKSPLTSPRQGPLEGALPAFSEEVMGRVWAPPAWGSES